MKFKIIWKNTLQSKLPNIASCRIRLDVSLTNKLEELKSLVADKFKNFGFFRFYARGFRYRVRDNFDLFWQDEEGDHNVIMDNDDLLEALDELNGPLYELIACIHSKSNKGKYMNYFLT